MKKMSEHSEKFQMVKDFYDSGQWKKKAVKNAVKKAWITAAVFNDCNKVKLFTEDHIKSCT